MAAPDEPNVREDADAARALATFEVYASCPDRELDEFLTRTVREFDSKYGSPSQNEGGGVAREVRRIVRAYFPDNVSVERVRVRYGESVTITFALVLGGAIGLYDFLSKYDDIRKSLDRIAEDVRALILSVGHWWHGPFPGPPGMPGFIRSRATWTPGPLLRTLPSDRVGSCGVSVGEVVRAWRTFALFLIVLSAILFTTTVVLVWLPVSRFYGSAKPSTPATGVPATTQTP